ncbi:MAG TPA: hypothetical protein DDX51_01680 [Clostridiales bacterium]|nr:hypothetical protein [Clostridiales bacterium]
MDPQQELFTALRVRLESLGCGVYDGALPPEQTPYPFVYLADSHLTDARSKSAVFGTVVQTVHIWHNRPDRRGTLSALLSAAERICRGVEHTASFAWDLRHVDQRILTYSRTHQNYNAHTTTQTPLMHGVLELEYRFCGR